LEVVVKGKRYEKQLKGGGRTPYCRGADGRAVLRSSIREFLAQELMHSLDVPTTRSLTLYVSKKEKVRRPWFRDGSYSRDPEVMIEESVAISIRVASSFIRVGQLELFGRRARKNEHPDAMRELEQIVLHLIEREYAKEIDANLPLEEKIILLAKEFCNRLTKLVADWIRVGYTQGNFNSDNCSSGGFTLDYGPFGFIDMFDPRYQPWTGGGVHFSFLNQPKAAEVNFDMFCKALEPLLKSKDELYKIRDNFSVVMQQEMQMMWAKKLGMSRFDKNLFEQLMMLMIRSSVDYTIFFRELSNIPQDITPLKKSFYSDIPEDALIIKEWSDWLDRWRASIDDEKSMQMKQVNPKYTLREWILVPAYEQANNGDYTLLKELQEVMNDPYSEQSLEIEKKYYNKKPSNLFYAAGVSHISCSS
ncbi:MAG: YdiU family protein, partial [Campylobacterales bacterium]|nr:YdiU family protein [Campylobacterales bacterium]